MEFTHLNELLVENFNKMTEGATHLFEVGLDRDEMWALYLDSFPPGSNEIFRERREFDCGCCRQFVKTIGNVVAIKDNVVYTIWGLETGDEVYQPVLDALDVYVKSKVVSDIWLGESQKVGTLKNFEPLESGKTIQWDHFYLEIPKHFVNNKDVTKKSIAELIAPFRDARNVFERSLNELTQESVLTVLELIAQNSLYKGEENKFVLTEFLKHKKVYDSLQTEEKSNYTWEQSVKMSGAISKIRNTSIGSLLIDISENMDLDAAVRKYEKMVAGENYKRSKPIYSKKMVEDALKTVEEAGYKPSLPRQHAKVDDITIQNIIFANEDAASRIGGGDVFDEMLSEVAINPKKFSKVDEISIEHLVKNVLSSPVQSLELFVENRHAPNFVSLIGPVNKDSKSMFKWDNGFSWAYAGNITDSSMKERVKELGGKVDGVLRFSIQWNDSKYDGNDLDAHCKEPGGYEIYYRNKQRFSPTGGMLDVDIIEPEEGVPAVENITWADKSEMKKGTYVFFVENFNNRGGKGGFKAEIEFDGVIHTFEYNKELRHKERVMVAEVEFDGVNFTIKEKLPSNVSSKEVWNVKTNQFVPVTVAMLSPNYWDGQKAIGHKHYFFMLKDCVNPESPNGFYNEFLKEDLMKHRRVFEALGSKMAVQTVEDQLSGLGFSSTKRNHVLIKIKGQSERVVKVTF